MQGKNSMWVHSLMKHCDNVLPRLGMSPNIKYCLENGQDYEVPCPLQQAFVPKCYPKLLSIGED